MVTLYPREAVAAGAPDGLHVEVAAAGEVLGPATPGAVRDGNDVLVFVRVHVGHPASVRADGRRCGLAEGGGDGLGGGAVEGLAVETLGILPDAPLTRAR